MPSVAELLDVINNELERTQRQIVISLDDYEAHKDRLNRISKKYNVVIHANPNIPCGKILLFSSREQMEELLKIPEPTLN